MLFIFIGSFCFHVDIYGSDYSHVVLDSVLRAYIAVYESSTVRCFKNAKVEHKK